MSKPLTFCRSDPRFVGDPIDVLTGANTDVITDVRRRGPIPFEWKRYYNSARAATFCPLGWGHSHHFDRRLIRDLDGVRYQDPHGNSVPFSEIAIGRREAVGGLVLTRSATDLYYLQQEGQPSEEFQFAPGATVALLRWLRQGRHCVLLKYVAGGRLAEIVDSLGRTIRVASNKNGLVTELVLDDAREGTSLLRYEYDMSGNLIRATDRANTTLTFAFDVTNRMTRRTDRRGYSFHFRYDGEGRCIHSLGDDGLLEVFLNYQTDTGTTFVRRGDGGQWIYTYNGNKIITQITDPYGNATKFIIDECGRSVQEVDPNGNVTELHYNSLGGHDYRIDSRGHVFPTKADDPDATDPLAYELPKTPLEWDLGSLVAKETIETPQANDPVLDSFPVPVVDIVLARTTSHDAAAPPQNALHAPERLLQNDFGHFLEIKTARFAERWKYDRNGNLIEHQDRDGSVYRRAYKSWNACNQVIDPLGNVTSVDVNVQGLVVKVTDPGGTVTEYRYDLRDLLVEVHLNGTLREKYLRDQGGNIIQKVDNQGRTLVTWEVGPGNLDKTEILNSGEKRSLAYDTRGRIINGDTSAGTVTFAHDDDGNLVADKRDGKGVSHQFESRQLLSTTYFDKFKVMYETLENGDRIVQDPMGGRHRFQVGKTGLFVKYFANGSKELSQFDRNGRCSCKAVIDEPQDSTPWIRRYAYSATGDLLAVTDTKRGTTKYRHDAAHRLIEEIRPGGHARRFHHDAAGNLLEQPGLNGVVIEEANRIREANGQRYGYNNRGDVSERQGLTGTTRYEYDALDMLVRCDVDGELWTANYDGFGRRIKKSWRGEASAYYWDEFRLSAEVRQNGSCRVYIYADHVALSPFLFIEYESLDVEPGCGTRYYIFTNQVAAPIRVVDDAGQVCWNAQIDPYGTARVDGGSTIEMPLRFPGHYFDQETGLHYNRFRYFSPALGRYIQSDPAGQFGGINLYAYLHDPLSHVDIDGLARNGGGNARKPKGQKPPQGLKPGCALLNVKGAAEMSDAQLKAELEKRAKEMAKKLEKGDVKVPGPPPYTLSKKHLQPCLAVVVDKNGNVYYGQNTGEFPRDMDKRLARNAAEQAGKEPLRTDVSAVRSGATQYPGTHGEVHATDRAIKNGADPNDVTVHNLNPKTGKEMPCCPNCTGTLNADRKGSGPGVKTTTPPEDRDGFVDKDGDSTKKERAEFSNLGEI
jgi:RHS repeat-associated protein